jgi:hypothetical protein
LKFYKVKENEVASTLKYLASDELEGRESGTVGMENLQII